MIDWISLFIAIVLLMPLAYLLRFASRRGVLPSSVNLLLCFSPASGSEVCGSIFVDLSPDLVTSIIYSIGIVVNSLFGWTLLPESWVLELIDSIKATYVKACVSEYCSAFANVHRVCFALMLCHLILCLSLLRVRSLGDKLAAIQNGYWGYKIVAWILLLLASFFIPDIFFIGWGTYVSPMFALLFYIYGLLILVDFAQHWADLCLNKIETLDSQSWRVILLGSTFGIYILNITLIILLYIFFGHMECHSNIAAITLNLAFMIFVSGVSVNATIQEYNPQAGLAQSAFVSLYCTFLTISALSSEPDDTRCSPKMISTAFRDMTAMFNSGITVLAIVYLTANKQGWAYGNYRQIQYRHEIDEFLDEDLGDDNEAVDENVISYNYSLFHCILILALMWISTLLTDQMGDEHLPFLLIARSSAYAWAEIVGSWLCFGMYIFTLIAPIMMPRRQQREASL
ncbi:serine incorporator/TMS membrane protein [Dipodascopsis uninucleata]